MWNYHVGHLCVGRLQNMMPHSSSMPPTSAREGFELLGLKWQPRLTSHQARQLTPFEVGNKAWKSSVHTLTSGKYACTSTEFVRILENTGKNCNFIISIPGHEYYNGISSKVLEITGI